MIRNVTYQDAHARLQSILRAKEFHAAPEREPWYVPVIRWIAKHLHLSVTTGQWKAATLGLSILTLGVLLFAVAWWMKRIFSSDGTIRIATVRRRAQKESAMAMAESALAEGNVPSMLHWLSEVCLTYAQHQGWIRYAPFKTARQYRREFMTAATPDFRDLYTLVSTDAEQVLFANGCLSREDAFELFERVKQSVTEGVV